MVKSPLFGRRIHISGSVVDDVNIASTANVKQARELIESLVCELMGKGASFVVPVDAEKLRDNDSLPICFDWLIWQTIQANLSRRPTGAPNPLIIAVQHHKNEEQIPNEFQALWDDLRNSDLVKIENVSHWNMNSKRMEAQAKYGDILLTLGGGEGVLFLANLYHDAGKPVVPLNLPITSTNTGALKLFNFGMSSQHTQRLFRVNSDTIDSHRWLNRINFSSRVTNQNKAQQIIGLLEELERPHAFVVRLLNEEHKDYQDVQNFFDIVVQPVIENELGYQMIVIDGEQAFEKASVVDEIFTKLHRSSVVLADITGMRPNCFIELGYALGRNLSTMLMARHKTEHPFDVSVFSGHHWKTTGSAEERKRDFRKHWNAIKNRPPIVPTEPLIP